MNEILSQSQIDDLLNALTTGETKFDEAASHKKIKKYDFATPKRVSKDHIKSLKSIFDNYVRFLSSYFTGVLRMTCEIETISLEEQRYYEYNNALPDRIMMCFAEIPPIEGSVLMDISRPIVYMLIDRILGGSGKVLDIERDYTEIEIALMDKVFKQMINFWTNITSVTPILNKIETNSRLIQIYRQDQEVVIACLGISIQDLHGTISVCIPCLNLETILDQMNSKFKYGQKIPDSVSNEFSKQELISHLRESTLEISCILGETSLTINDIYNLELGDTIQLDQKINSKLKVKIGEETRFTGVLGVKKNRKAVKISEVF